ncbi:FtsX-like permease family protein [Streptomyces sp. NPDC127108]|uniref:FtsX-like permease family protein n=1 Tax=Streptomyces sp. NPDC127108 TaxID=3345361 RepID=UPI00363B496D
MIRIALRTLRHHRNGFLASFIALFFGAAIVVGCGGLLQSALKSTAEPQRLAAAPILVSADQRYLGTQSEEPFVERVPVDAKLAQKLKSVDGVAATAADVSFPAALGSADGKRAEAKVTGHGWSSAKLTPYRVSDGVAPSKPGQVVLDERLAGQAGLKPGDRVRLLVGGGTQNFEVSGLARGDGGSGTVFLTDARAAELSTRPGKADVIGVFPDSGADTAQVAKAVEKTLDTPALTVLTGSERGRAENPDIVSGGDDLVALAAAFGGLAAMVTVFVVASTLGLSIQQRQREMALLRAIGTTPGQLRRLILGETLLLTVIATALACALGPQFGRVLLDAFASAGVVPDTMEFHPGSVPLIAGAATALVTAVGAAFIAARGPARTRPTEALAEAGLERSWFSWPRVILAVLCLGGGTALAVVTAGMDGPKAAGAATPAAMVWTAGFGLLGPVLARAMTRGLFRPLRSLSGLSGRLATLNSEARTARFAGAVMPVMLATGLAIALIYMQTTNSRGAERAFDDSLRADLAVTSDAGGLPLDMVEKVRRQPGVAAASAQVSSMGYVEPRTPVEPTADSGEGAADPPEMALAGITPEGISKTTAFRATEGSLDALRGESVALPTRYTDGHKIGDMVPMRLGDGSLVKLKLVATVKGERGYETALLPAAFLAAHTDSGLIPRIMVTAEPGTDRAELTATLSALSGDQPGLRVTTRDTLAAAQAEQDDTQAWMAYLVLGVVVGYAVIALVNTQALATTERRREFMLQRLIGATRRQVMQMMAMEAALVSLAGILLGSLVAALTLVPLSMSVLGTATPEGSPWIFAAVVSAAFALTLATTLVSALTVLRNRPVEAVGVRE